MQYIHIFGPVISRRLGISLGVDLVTHKICSMDCIYCECGATTRLTTHREEYVPFDRVKQELSHYFDNHPDPDYITFSGSGEPTLNSCIGKVIGFIKKRKPDVKVCVLTNSSLLSDPGVRQDLQLADLVVPSLDAVSTRSFERINRPESEIDVQTVIERLVSFARDFKGEIWLEVFILPGINDDKEDLQKLAGIIKTMQPDRVQLNTLDRPGTQYGLIPASSRDLERVKTLLNYDDTQIIARVDQDIQAGVRRDNIRRAVLETIHRRPCTKQDLVSILGVEKDALDSLLEKLEKERVIFGTQQDRGVFYQTVKEADK